MINRDTLNTVDKKLELTIYPQNYSWRERIGMAISLVLGGKIIIVYKEIRSKND